jgi:hypothetical protein
LFSRNEKLFETTPVVPAAVCLFYLISLLLNIKRTLHNKLSTLSKTEVSISQEIKMS